MKHSAKKAFSLIELSIVILIIGILIAGITQSSRLVKKFKIITAQNLTRNSPIAGIKDLTLWLETTMEASFIPAETENTTQIAAWYDLNPQSSYKNHAAQATTGNKPRYTEDVFNGAIPGIRFDGGDDFMTFDGSSLINTDYTIFVVEQRRDGANDNHFIGGTDSVGNANLHLGYETSTNLKQGHYANDLDFGVPPYSVPNSRIHTFRFSQTVSQGKMYWENGGVSVDAAQTGQLAPIASYTGSALGRYNTNYYNGDIAEIIAYRRALKTEERQAVETYLSKKYAISITP